jgi:hypothetical protein
LFLAKPVSVENLIQVVNEHARKPETGSEGAPIAENI